MKTKTAAVDIKVADLLLLTLIGIPTSLGYAFSVKPGFAVHWLATLLVLEAMYLGWLARQEKGADKRKKILAFGLKMQAQATVQMAMFVCSTLLVVALLSQFGAALDPADTLWKLVNAGNVLSLGDPLARITIVTSLAIAWARVHFFGKSGVAISAVAGAGFNRRVIRFPAAPAAVVEAMVRHVDKLHQKGAPRYSRYFYEADISLASYHTDSGAAFSLTWNYCPCLVKLVAVPAANGATDLQVNVELRRGYYKLELFPNPVDVQVLMTFLQTHVFQLMSSELALSNALTKQNTLRAQAVESQLRILQAQIEPHFLFNTLANVRHLYRSSVDAGEEMMDHLIVYLRSTLEDLRSDASTVGKEMDLVLHYLAIMQIRMGDRLSYGFIVPDGLSQHSFPPAMLISLVENAIKHGIQDKANGKLTISCARDGEHVRVTVADNGAGFSSVDGTGVGLSNIRQRLEAMHASRAWLEVGALADGGFIASVMVPFEGTK